MAAVERPKSHGILNKNKLSGRLNKKRKPIQSHSSFCHRNEGFTVLVKLDSRLHYLYLQKYSIFNNIFSSTPFEILIALHFSNISNLNEIVGVLMRISYCSTALGVFHF